MRATTRTRASIPASKPVATIDASRRMSHILNFRDDATSRSKAKPAGVTGAEIWCAVVANGTPAPARPAQFKLLSIDSTPHLVEHDPADAGKTAHYMLRWVNTRGEKGPWSATIPG